MKLGIRITRSPQDRGKIAELTTRLKDLNPAFVRGAIIVLSDAQGRIRDHGPGWPPTLETSVGSPLYRTGALFRSLTIGAPGNVDEQIAGGIRVGTNLTTPGGGYNIGRLMQYGTGAIVPRNAKFLRFKVNGQWIFSKGTKGIPARRFLFISAQTARRVLAAIVAYIKRGVPE